ncbi:hemin-degrading factor [Paracoccus aestuariivivens]|uniref:Hemin-degrading factor n=1 Tax=Paracoccus aestuariivivens TaxID=1820333 RepID=A0A6L6J8Y8_9RHOB|nr:ChuX/HutX family heme-like substrate-binding protein [Paracoccus aestuariivivens]MTH77117.1 hemin-degrading factor [Paracoccus aestuariivivens]
MTQHSPSDLRRLQAEETGRPVDLAAKLGVAEGALVAAQVGHGAIRIDPTLGRLFPAIQALGDVMALTRNRSCVIEKIGTYNNFHDGDHASMTLDPEIDMRMFPRHWVHAFAVEKATDAGIRRSVQVFDAAGDAVHKVHLRDSSDLAAWDALKRDLVAEDQSDSVEFGPRAPVEPARASADRADALRREWDDMTDTHQFNTLIHRQKMNRLGAYRIAGAPYVLPLAIDAVPALLERVQADSVGIMFFVGNMGCIEIHSGKIETLKPMGPWLNVLDERFNLHLRADHVAEVWAVHKPTKRGPAISVEAFDAEGALIFQCFGLRPEKGGDAEQWAKLVAGLPMLTEAVA